MAFGATSITVSLRASRSGCVVRPSVSLCAVRAFSFLCACAQHKHTHEMHTRAHECELEYGDTGCKPYQRIRDAEMQPQDAEATCQTEGGHLASASTAEENAFLARLARKPGTGNAGAEGGGGEESIAWIGLHKPLNATEFRWTDESEVVFSFFLKGMPLHGEGTLNPSNGTCAYIGAGDWWKSECSFTAGKQCAGRHWGPWGGQWGDVVAMAEEDPAECFQHGTTSMVPASKGCFQEHWVGTDRDDPCRQKLPFICKIAPPLVCAAGYYSATGSYPCTPCPVDTTSTQANSTSCTACRTGTHTNGQNGSTWCIVTVTIDARPARAVNSSLQAQQGLCTNSTPCCGVPGQWGAPPATLTACASVEAAVQVLQYFPGDKYLATLDFMPGYHVLHESLELDRSATLVCSQCSETAPPLHLEDVLIITACRHADWDVCDAETYAAEADACPPGYTLLDHDLNPGRSEARLCLLFSRRASRISQVRLLVGPQWRPEISQDQPAFLCTDDAGEGSPRGWEQLPVDLMDGFGGDLRLRLCLLRDSVGMLSNLTLSPTNLGPALNWTTAPTALAGTYGPMDLTRDVSTKCWAVDYPGALAPARLWVCEHGLGAKSAILDGGGAGGAGVRLLHADLTVQNARARAREREREREREKNERERDRQTDTATWTGRHRNM